eukprot:7383632-Prymnesium_polylepis.1
MDRMMDRIDSPLASLPARYIRRRRSARRRRRMVPTITSRGLRRSRRSAAGRTTCRATLRARATSTAGSDVGPHYLVFMWPHLSSAKPSARRVLGLGCAATSERACVLTRARV